jgi:hypothetical protein
VKTETEGTLAEGQNRLAYLKELRIKIRGVLDGSIDAAAIQNYAFSDSDGSQSAHRRSPEELWDFLQKVENEIAALESRLHGGGIRTFGMRRFG